MATASAKASPFSLTVPASALQVCNNFRVRVSFSALLLQEVHPNTEAEANSCYISLYTSTEK